MGIKSEPYLSTMLNRNLYSPSDEYDISNPKVVQTIDSITKFLSNGTSDFNNTLLSRVIGGHNTKLSQLATQELLEAMTKRVASYLRQNELPMISMDGLSIKVTQPLKYWKITPDNSIEGSLSSLLETLSGYTPTVNPVPSVSEMVGDSNKEKLEYHNKWLKENLGENNKREYENQTGLNEYSDNTNNIYSEGVNNRINIYNDGGIKKSIDDLKIDNSLENRPVEFRGNEYPAYYPITNIDDLSTNENLLVGKIGDKIMAYAVAYRHMKDDGSIKLISKGSGVFKDNDGEEFLRVFTEGNQYDSPRKALKFAQPNTSDRQFSTLKTVFPVVAPNTDEDYKNLMFSITNLSYRDYNSIGNGNNLNDKNQKDTMWFVPYGLTINEQVSVGWEKVDILGRSEPLYTYNGTERKCSLSFILIADYPAELNKINKWSDATNNDFNKFYRQDNEFVDGVKPNKDDITIKEVENSKQQITTEPNIGDNPYPSSSPLKYYFDNNDFSLKTTFNNDDNLKTGEKGVANFNSKFDDLLTFLNSDIGKYYKIIIQGHSSALYKSKYNLNLSYKRAKSIYDIFAQYLTDKGMNQLTVFNEPLTTTNEIPKSALVNDRFVIKPIGENGAINTVELNIAMVDRYVSVYLELDVSRVSVNNKDYSDDNVKSVTPQNNSNNINSVEDFRFINPNLDMVIGEELNTDLRDNLLKTYANNIKYFMPVYHSQTPIDLNQRVTFLQQCARQGNQPNSINVDANIGNSIFGKPPVCVLRLGDFLHTKMLIESIDFNYEPLIWDSNPEGIGMQPLMCTVNISCIILGGSSLSQPINTLQNALANNYYANTELYKK